MLEDLRSFLQPGGDLAGSTDVAGGYARLHLVRQEAERARLLDGHGRQGLPGFREGRPRRFLMAFGQLYEAERGQEPRHGHRLHSLPGRAQSPLDLGPRLVAGQRGELLAALDMFARLIPVAAHDLQPGQVEGGGREVRLLSAVGCQLKHPLQEGAGHGDLAQPHKLEPVDGARRPVEGHVRHGRLELHRPPHEIVTEAGSCAELQGGDREAGLADQALVSNSLGSFQRLPGTRRRHCGVGAPGEHPGQVDPDPDGQRSLLRRLGQRLLEEADRVQRGAELAFDDGQPVQELGPIGPSVELRHPPSQQPPRLFRLAEVVEVLGGGQGAASERLGVSNRGQGGRPQRQVGGVVRRRAGPRRQCSLFAGRCCLGVGTVDRDGQVARPFLGVTHGFGETPVQRPASRRRHAHVDGRTQQGVGEAHPLVLDLDHVGLRRLPERRSDPGGVSADLDQDRNRCLGERRGGRHHLLGGSGELGKTGPQQLVEAARNRYRRSGLQRYTGSLKRARDLEREERVAPGRLPDPDQGCVWEGRPQARGQQALKGAQREGAQRQPGRSFDRRERWVPGGLPDLHPAGCQQAGGSAPRSSEGELEHVQRGRV